MSIQLTAGSSRSATRWSDTVLARVLSPWLDERIARDDLGNAGPLLAARCAQLVEPAGRRVVADAWDHLLRRAAEPRTLADPRVPVARADVLGAAAEIDDLTAALRSAAPVAARDVARARALLTDAGSPVYRGQRGLREVVAQLAAALLRPRCRG